MVKFQSDFLQKIRENTNITDIVGSYVSLKKKGKRYWGCCPFHNEKTPSFSVSPEDGLYYCFGCHEGGDTFSFLQKMENLTFIEAVERLAELVHIELPQAEMSVEEQRRHSQNQELYKVLDLAAVYFHNCLTKTKIGVVGKEYFQDRNLSDNVINQFKLGFAPASWHKLYHDFTTIKHIQDKVLVDSGLVGYKNGRHYDMFRNRCMFPILDVKGRVVAFGGRVLDDSKPKYLNSPETSIFNKRKLLFAFYQALPEIKKTRQAIMVEGYMDAISLHAHGIKNVVASLGTAFTIEQARLLKRYADEVVFSYDMDEAGQKATKQALEIANNVGLSIRVLKLSEGKDPDEFVNYYGKESYLEAVIEAKPAMDYLLSSLLKQYDRTSLEGQHLILAEMFSVLSARGDSFEFNLYIQKMAQALRVDEGLVRNEAKLYAEKNNPKIYISQQNQRTEIEIPLSKEEEKQKILEEEIIRYCLVSHRKPEGWETLSTYDFIDGFCKRMYQILSVLLQEDKAWTQENATPLMEQNEIKKLASLIVKEGRLAIDAWEEYIRPLKIISLQKLYKVHTEKVAAFLEEGNREAAIKEQQTCIKINREIRSLKRKV